MEVPDEDIDSDHSSEWSELTEEDEDYTDDALTSFRMLLQRLEGEAVEEEPEEEGEEIEDISDADSETDEDDETPLAEVEEITAKLQSRGITMLDLVAMLTDRKSSKVAKHTDRFMDAFDRILDNAIEDCDREAKERASTTITTTTTTTNLVLHVPLNICP
jgi:hypothetical protein